MASKKREPDRDTVNGRLQDRAIRHAIYLQRYGTSISADMLAFFEDSVFPDLLAKLESRLNRINLRGYDSGVHTTNRYREMLADLLSILIDGGSEASKRLLKIQRELAGMEATWQANVLLGSVPKDLHVYVLPERPINLAIARQVVSQPIEGKPMKAWWNELARKTQDRLTREIGVGLSQSETSEQIVRRVKGTAANGYRDGVLEVTRAQARSIVRTTTNHVTTQARETTYREMEDVVKGVQWVATLDTKTCPICRPLDGKVYPVGEGQRPPGHFGCRCTTVPVLKSIREILGKKPLPDSVSPGTRASMDGQVPASLTYDEWIRGQPAGVQDEAFGPTRARMFRAGEVTSRDLVTRTGRTKSIDELMR